MRSSWPGIGLTMTITRPEASASELVGPPAFPTRRSEAAIHRSISVVNPTTFTGWLGAGRPSNRLFSSGFFPHTTPGHLDGVAENLLQGLHEGFHGPHPEPARGDEDRGAVQRKAQRPAGFRFLPRRRKAGCDGDPRHVDRLRRDPERDHVDLRLFACDRVPSTPRYSHMAWRS